MKLDFRAGWLASMMVLSALAACGGTDDKLSGRGHGGSGGGVEGTAGGGADGGGGSGDGGSGDGDGGGGGEQAGACGEVAPCGGDPTGSWTVEDSCLDIPMDLPASGDCVPVSDASGVEIQGGFEFNADNTYAATLTLGGSLSFIFPAACFSGEDMTLTCASLEESMSDSLGDGVFTSVECVPMGEDCVCSLALREGMSADTGSWSVDRDTLTTASDDGSDAAEVGFCVDGATLALELPNAEEPGAEAPVIAGHLRLKKN